MNVRQEFVESCIFSYYFSEKEIKIDELRCKHYFGKYTMLTDNRTPYFYASDENSECAIFGYAINVFTKESNTLAHKIITCCIGISDVIEFEKNLGGKYIILYRYEDQYYFLGDATCSIPVFYNLSGWFACSSNEQYLVNQFGYLPNQKLQTIRYSGEISQAMPFDVTQYIEIKQLLPNHYLYINGRRPIRFINSTHNQTALTVEEAVKLSLPLIETMCEFYKQRFTIYCPITSGRDSRVVLAFLSDQHETIHCYTIKHPEHSEYSQDLVIPKLLCSENLIPYEIIDDVIISADLKRTIDYLLGENNYSLRTLRIAQTIYEHYGNGAIINGDIIGQVGKCSLHRDIPLFFATPSYFRCKLHNYSKESKKELKLWLNEIKSNGECINTFDLFSIENRMGRWAAQENLIYNTIGQIYLNIFNSRSIIYLWTAVNRKKRKESSLHIELIKHKNPDFLKTPFESDESSIVRLSKTNYLTYLLSSYAKYYIERIKFKRGN